MTRSRIIQVLGLAAVNFGAGKLGLLLAVPPGYASAVWPPSGIALAALLLAGYRVWPGIFLGTFLLHLLTSGIPAGSEGLVRPLLTASVIGIGSTAQALLGADLLRRFVGLPTRLDSGREVAKSILFAGPLSCLIGATVGMGTLWSAGVVSGSAALFSWWTWWAGDSLGVIVFTPLLLLAFSPFGQTQRARLRAVGIPMAVAFIVTIALYLLTSGWEHHRIRLEFERLASRGAEAFEVELERNLEVLHSVERFYSSRGEVDRQEFHRFVSPLFPGRPGLMAVSWDPRVPGESRAAFESSIRRSGHSDFVITERDSGDHLVPARPRGQYVPILYLEPTDGQQALLGFDLASDPVRVDALDRARDLGVPAATGRITLVQNPPSSDGVVIFQPIFRSQASPQTQTERRANLLGYVSGVVQIGVLLGAAGERVDPASIGLGLYDETDPGEPRLIHALAPAGGAPENGAAPGVSRALRWERRLEVAGRRWMLRFEPTPDYALAQRSWGAWLVLAGGLLFAGLLQAFLLILTGSTVRTESLVAARTAELVAANRSLSEEMLSRTLAEERALEAVRAKSQFLATMSHELRTPLNSVLGFSNVLLENREGHLAPQEVTWLQRVQANGRHLLALINSVLDLSKVEAGRTALDLTQVALGPLIDDIVAHLAPLVVGRPIELRGQVPAPLQEIEADLPKLRQILLNLTSNAVKFTEAGRIVIRVVADRRGRPIRLEVEDSGIGIPTDRHEAIFEAFEQGDNSISRRYGGTGLGLAISRSLAHLMGFRLSLRSEAGVGSTFVLHLKAV
jgi:signal transduction histidine kinase